MRILVACEYSGTVRDAFRALGHDAISCDVLPSDRPGPHVQGDVSPLLRERWDMVIAHPPCTYLSYAGNRYWNQPGREEKRRDAMAFFRLCYDANAPRVCVENPVGLPGREFRKPDQIIEPFFFGDAQRKRTCLWLRGLRPLMHRATDELFGPQTHTDEPTAVYATTREDGTVKLRHFTEANHDPKVRSKTFQGIADAMAAQWGHL